ncbi:hypothetical protein D3C78_1859540 [compost metagenome]
MLAGGQLGPAVPAIARQHASSGAGLVDEQELLPARLAARLHEIDGILDAKPNRRLALPHLKRIGQPAVLANCHAPRRHRQLS